MTFKVAWIVCLILAVLVMGVSVWISVFYLRLQGTRNRRSSGLSVSTTICVIWYGVAITYSTASSVGWLCVAGGLFLASLFLLWGSVRAHGKKPPAFAFLENAPHSFVRSGPYRLVRHPLYTAYLLALVAGAVLANNYWLLLAVPWLGSFYYVAARAEEQSFRDTPFAEQYESYRAVTGMFFPRPWLLRYACADRASSAIRPESNDSNGT